MPDFQHLKLTVSNLYSDCIYNCFTDSNNALQLITVHFVNKWLASLTVMCFMATFTWRKFQIHLTVHINIQRFVNGKHLCTWNAIKLCEIFAQGKCFDKHIHHRRKTSLQAKLFLFLWYLNSFTVAPKLLKSVWGGDIIHYRMSWCLSESIVEMTHLIYQTAMKSEFRRNVYLPFGIAPSECIV